MNEIKPGPIVAVRIEQCRQGFYVRCASCHWSYQYFQTFRMALKAARGHGWWCTDALCTDAVPQEDHEVGVIWVYR